MWLGAATISSAWLWSHRRDPLSWPIIPAVLILFYLVTSLTSPKYLLPLLCFVPLFLAWGISNVAPESRKVVSLVTILFAIVFQFVPLVTRKEAPFVALDWAGERPVLTHDVTGELLYGAKYPETEAIRSLVAAPVMVAGAPIGLLTLMDLGRGVAWQPGEDEFRFCRIAAGLLAPHALAARLALRPERI